MAQSLLARINLIKNADIIKDIIVLTYLNFHKLYNKGSNSNLSGLFAIDVKRIFRRRKEFRC